MKQVDPTPPPPPLMAPGFYYIGGSAAAYCSDPNGSIICLDQSSHQLRSGAPMVLPQ